MKSVSTRCPLTCMQDLYTLEPRMRLFFSADFVIGKSHEVKTILISLSVLEDGLFILMSLNAVLPLVARFRFLSFGLSHSHF